MGLLYYSSTKKKGRLKNVRFQDAEYANEN